MARTSLSLDSASLSSLNFRDRSNSSSSGTVFPMNVPHSISLILETSMPSGLRACSMSSHNFSISLAKVVSRFSMSPTNRLKWRGSMWKWSKSSTISGSGVLDASSFGGSGATGLGRAMLPAMPPALLTPPIIAIASIGFAPAVIARRGLAAMAAALSMPAPAKLLRQGDEALAEFAAFADMLAIACFRNAAGTLLMLISDGILRCCGSLATPSIAGIMLPGPPNL